MIGHLNASDASSTGSAGTGFCSMMMGADFESINEAGLVPTAMEGTLVSMNEAGLAPKVGFRPQACLYERSGPGPNDDGWLPCLDERGRPGPESRLQVGLEGGPHPRDLFHTHAHGLSSYRCGPCGWPRSSLEPLAFACEDAELSGVGDGLAGEFRASDKVELHEFWCGCGKEVKEKVINDLTVLDGEGVHVAATREEMGEGGNWCNVVLAGEAAPVDDSEILEA
ncbi:hypothetical protein BC938DRAFT_483425 [Jimgerdemannia flammicorona]|uniref:Uncharacterized protein n=1 Tax=Jimgerdemannia flammicorona TaxID=994334 RepID=A0A433QVW0_9FUNG|nr:hypothetical protein BC938DRAFT_483425 [Jimgerdemannia flammicorona]